MSWSAGLSLLMIVLAFLLGVLVGWFVWGRRRGVGAGETAARQPTVVVEPAIEEVADRALPEAVATAAGQSTPTEADAQGSASAGVPDDDLQRIDGVGPQMAAALHRAGIRTFGQLADVDEDTVRAALDASGLRFAPSLVTWARQARLLADGDDVGLTDLRRRLVAGRDEGRL